MLKRLQPLEAELQRKQLKSAGYPKQAMRLERVGAVLCGPGACRTARSYPRLEIASGAPQFNSLLLLYSYAAAVSIAQSSAELTSLLITTYHVIAYWHMQELQAAQMKELDELQQRVQTRAATASRARTAEMRSVHRHNTLSSHDPFSELLLHF